MAKEKKNPAPAAVETPAPVSVKEVEEITPKSEAASKEKTEKKTKANNSADNTPHPIDRQVFVEFGGEQYSMREVMSKCEESYKKLHPRKKSFTMTLYVNIAEKRAYYVVDGKSEGLYIDL